MNKILLLFPILLLVIFLNVFLIGCCNILSIGKDTGEIESFPTVPVAQDGSVLYFDDFSSINSNWDLGQWDNGGADYYNDSYLVDVPNENNISTYLHQSFPKDVILEVDVLRLGQASRNNFYAGIYLRHSRDGSGYWFTITRDQDYGSAGIFSLHQSEGPSIGTLDKSWKWPQNWGETYHIRADAIGDQLSLYVNGYLVESAIDTTITQDGEIGLFGGRYGDIQYLFDNLIVYAP